MERTAEDNQPKGLSRAYLLVLVGFSAAAFLARWIGLTIPVAGTGVANIDPREIFVTLGSAFTGPVGGIVIGFFGGIASFPSQTVVVHMVSGLFLGFLYKPVYNRWPMPKLLLGWAVLIAAYYYIFIIPTFLATVLLTYPGGLSDIFGADLGFLQAYIILVQAASLEALATLIITAIVLLALPKYYRRPLW